LLPDHHPPARNPNTIVATFFQHSLPLTRLCAPSTTIFDLAGAQVLRAHHSSAADAPK
jgi:hypothetical protein